MASAETARLIASLELQDKNFTRGLKNAERGLGRIDKKLGAASGALNRNLARGIDTVVSKSSEFLVGTVRDATEFESAITGVAKTVTGDISGVTDELKKMSTEIPLSFVELAGIAELGGAMGIAKEDLVAFTEQVAILGTTTNVSTEDAATALGQLQNVIGLTGDEFDNFAASLVDLGNKGASTESAILEIAKRSGGAAKLVGIAKDETLGWAAAAANLGLNEELAGTALQNLFIKGAKSQAKLAKVAGVNVKKFEKLWAKDATGALKLFLKQLGKLDQREQLKAVEDIFGKGSGLTRLILGLANDEGNLTDSLETGTKAWQEATAAQAEADKRFKTSESLFKRLDNSVKIVSATVGEALLPVLNDLATEAIDFLNKPETQKGIKNFAKSIGEGVRGLAKVVTSINWGAVAGFLGTAAGFAGDLVGWFSKMPDWAQAFLIGGFAVTKLPIIGDIVTSALKGALGITAGIVNVNGPVAGGAAGAAGAAGGAAKGGFLNRFIGAGGALRVVGSVAIIGAALVLWQKVADDFGKLQEFVKHGQGEINDTIARIAPTLTADEAVKNLKAVVSGVNKQNDLQKVLTAVVTGGQLTADFEVAADAIRHDQTLNRQEIVAALDALSSAKILSDGVLDTPGLDAAIKDLTARLEKMPSADPKDLTPVRRPDPGKAGVAGLAPAIKPLTTKVAATNVALSGIKTGIATASAAQKTEIGNVKNAVATMDQNQRANALAVVASQAAGQVLATIQAATQAIKTAGTTTAVNNTKAAVGGVAPAITPAVYAIGNQIAGAVWAARPVIQSTNVVNNYTRTERYGASGDSRQRRYGPTG